MTYQPPQQSPYTPGYGQPAPPPSYGQYPPQQYGQPATYGTPPPPFMPPQPPRPKKRALPFVVAGLAVVVVAVCGIASLAGKGASGTKTSVDQPVTNAAGTTAAGKTKAAAKPKQPATFGVPVGATLTVSADGATVKTTLRSVKTFKKACNDFAPAPDNGMFVVVDVLLVQTAGTGSVNPLDFTYVAADGTTANALSAAFSGCGEPSLDSTNSLQAGQKRAGKIAFDTDSGDGTLEWAPGGLAADAVGSWKVTG